MTLQSKSCCPANKIILLWNNVSSKMNWGLNISCLVKFSHLVVSVHAAKGKFCSQSHLWEVCSCLLLQTTTKRLCVSDFHCIHHLFTSLGLWKWKVETRQIIYLFLVNGSVAHTERGTSSPGWVKRWSH